jgi:hypothetical protein
MPPVRQTPRRAAALAGEKDLSGRPVRELVGLLAAVEDGLRETRFLVHRRGVMAANPDVAPLLARERAVVAELRTRRFSQGVDHNPGHASGGRPTAATGPSPLLD